MFFLKWWICWRQSKVFMWSITKAQQMTLTFMRKVTMGDFPLHCAYKMHLLIFPNSLTQGKWLISLAETWLLYLHKHGNVKICFPLLWAISVKSLQIWKIVRVKMPHFVKKGLSILKKLMSVQKIKWHSGWPQKCKLSEI